MGDQTRRSAQGAMISGNAGVFRVEGDMNLASAVSLKTEGQKLIRQAPQAVDVDLSGVRSASSAGISVLLCWMRTARQQQKTIRFISMPPCMVSIAKAGGVAAILPLTQ